MERLEAIIFYGLVMFGVMFLLLRMLVVILQDSFFRYKQLAHSIGAPYIHNEVRDLLCHARKRSEKRIWSLATRTRSGRETSFSQKHNTSPTRSEGAGWVTDSMKSLGAGSYDMAKISTPATLRCNLMPGGELQESVLLDVLYLARTHYSLRGYRDAAFGTADGRDSTFTAQHTETQEQASTKDLLSVMHTCEPAATPLPISDCPKLVKMKSSSFTCSKKTMKVGLPERSPWSFTHGVVPTHITPRRQAENHIRERKSVLPAAIALELAICSLSRPEDSPLSLIDAESLSSQRVPGPGKQIHGGAWKRRRQLRTVQLSSHSASSDDTQKTQ